MTDHFEPVPEFIEFDQQTVAVIAGRLPMGELPEFFDRSFTDLAGTLAAQDVAIIGPAFARYHGPPTDIADLEVGFPTDREVISAGDVTAQALPPGGSPGSCTTGPTTCSATPGDGSPPG